jgi:DNA-binding CsgD family transcriptional regulator
MAATATISRVPLAREVSVSRSAADSWPRLATGVLDLLEQGVLVVARDFRLLGVNRMGEALLREGDGLAAVQHNVIASTTSATFELRRGIERTAQGERRRLEVPRQGRTTLSVVVEPHPSAGGSAVVFASDPERQRESGLGALASRYGFTPTECEVAHQLATGQGLSAIAESLGITLNTVRGHLKHLYAKAGVHRQAELVARLLAN